MRQAILLAVALVLAGCGAPGSAPDSPAQARGAKAAEAAKASASGPTQEIQQSFRARGQAGLDRLQQSEMQKLCSREQPRQLPAQVTGALEAEALASVRYPEDGRWLGDWQRGEKIAQSGMGLESSDPAGAPSGGGCYGCHRLSGTEIAYGTIGPSLYRYLERNGNGPEALQRTWGRIWNPHAYDACSVMPRFGDAGILTPEQIRDVMALLFDPQSPVNR